MFGISVIPLSKFQQVDILCMRNIQVEFIKWKTDRTRVVEHSQSADRRHVNWLLASVNGQQHFVFSIFKALN